MTKITQMNPTQKNPVAKAPEPKCPYCGAKPIHYNIVTGFIPSIGYAIVQVFCNGCDALLTAVPAPIPQQEESPLGAHGDGVQLA